MKLYRVSGGPNQEARYLSPKVANVDQSYAGSPYQLPVGHIRMRTVLCDILRFYYGFIFERFRETLTATHNLRYIAYTPEN